MAEFHFLRPWWLALLPVAIWLIWQVVRGRAEGGGWRALVDPELRAHVLAEPEVLRESRWPLIALAACWRSRARRARGPDVGAAARSRVPFRRSARRRARSLAVDGCRRRRAVAHRARASQGARSARAAHGRADRARRVLDARVHGHAAHDRHANHRLARRRGQYVDHADAGQLARVRAQQICVSVAADGLAHGRHPRDHRCRRRPCRRRSRRQAARRRVQRQRARGRHRAGRADPTRRGRLRDRQPGSGRDTAARRRGAPARRGRRWRAVRAARARRSRSRGAVSARGAARRSVARVAERRAEGRHLARSRRLARARAAATARAFVPARLDRGLGGAPAAADAARARVRLGEPLASTRSARLRGAAAASRTSAPRSCSRIRSGAARRSTALRNFRRARRRSPASTRPTATTTAATRSRRRANSRTRSQRTIARSSSTRSMRTPRTTAIS